MGQWGGVCRTGEGVCGTVGGGVWDWGGVCRTVGRGV